MQKYLPQVTQAIELFDVLLQFYSSKLIPYTIYLPKNNKSSEMAQLLQEQKLSYFSEGTISLKSHLSLSLSLSLSPATTV
jgi:hypothetical protein